MPPLESHPSQFTKCHWCYLVCLCWACFFLLLISISTPQCRLFSFFSEIIANDVLVCNLISSNSFSTLLLVILWTENFIIIFPCLKFKRFPLGEKNPSWHCIHDSQVSPWMLFPDDFPLSFNNIPHPWIWMGWLETGFYWVLSGVFKDN